MKFNRNITKCLLWIVLINTILFSGTTLAALRGFQTGEKMPEFSAVNINDVNYAYEYDKGKPLLVLFISMGQQGSSRAAADINQVISNFGKDANNLEVTVIVEDSNNVFKKSEEFRLLKKFNIIIDSEYKLWGKFGMIATPTVIISDANDNIEWVKAGHNYDFIPNVRNHISHVLGLSKEPAEDEVQVKTAVNDTNLSHVKRLLDMAKILSDKGKTESAIDEVLKAKQLDPNSNEVKLNLAELLCKSNKNQEALDIIEEIRTTSNIEKAKALTLTGWANRQMDKLEIAQNCLLEALSNDPESVRTLFELGNVYRVQGETEKAMKVYYDALAIVLKAPKEPQETQ